MRTNELERRLEKLFFAGAADPDKPAPPLPVLDVAPIVGRPDHALTRGMVELARAMTGSHALVSGNGSDGPAFLKTILDQIPDPVYVKDRAHKLVVVNAAFCALTGRSEDQLLGGSAADYLAGVDESRGLDERVFTLGEASTVDQSIATDDGARRMWRVQRRALAGPNGGYAYLVGTIQDITARVEVERALQARDAEHRAEQAKWEEKFRKLRRGLLFQFSMFGAAAGLAVGGIILSRTPSVSAKIADTATPVSVVAVTLAPTRVEPSATPGASNTPAPTPTPYQPSVIVAPTANPDDFILNESAPPPAPLREFGPNVINIILMGSDRRPDGGGWRTDVLILVSIDPDVPSVTMLSFPRDMWVYIPTWRWQRINLADEHGEDSGFPGGGPALVKQVIQYNFGISVHYYARVDFSGYRHLIDGVGGVDVVADCPLYDIFPDVPDGENDIITGDALATVPTGTIDIPTAGVYHLDGKHALWYSRSRKTTSDFDRSRRQQRVLRALWAKLREQGVLSQVPQVWDTLTQSVETDLTLNDVVYLADLAARLDPAHIRSRFVDGSMLTWHTTETGASVLLYNYAEVAPYLDEAFAPMPKNITSQAPLWVDVLNASGQADWDRVAADRLGWSGFSVFSWDHFSTIAPRTQIVDYTTTAKGSRLDALAELFQVQPENIFRAPDPNSPVAYDVIVGQDFEACQPPSRGRWPAPPPTPAAAVTPAP